MTRTKISEDFKNDMINNYGRVQISYFTEKYNRTRTAIHQLAWKLKITNIYQLDRDEKEIVNRYNSGFSIKNLKIEFGHDAYTLLSILKKNGCHIRDRRDSHLKFRVNEDYFKQIDSHEKAYWLGFIYADGNIYTNKLQIGLADKDIEVLLNFKKHIQSEHKLYKDRDSIRFTVRSPKIVSDLNKLGVFPRKSLTLKFPTERQVSKKYINSFVLGYFDGDGHIAQREGINKHGYKFKRYDIGFISTKSFILKIRKILKEILYVNGCLHKENRTKENVWYISYGGGYIKQESKDKIKRLYNFLYRNIGFSLNRKKDIFHKIIC